MNKGNIELLFQYNDWANERILDTAEKMSHEQLTTPNDLGWGSLRGTLVHLLDAETVWRTLLKDGVFIEELNPEGFSDISLIRERWAAERQSFWAYLNGLSDVDLAGTIQLRGRRQNAPARTLALSRPCRQSRHAAPRRKRRPSDRFRSFAGQSRFHRILDGALIQVRPC